MTSLNEDLTSLLLTRAEYVSESGGLLQNKVEEDAKSLNAELIELLASHEGIFSHFFVSLGNYTVFDSSKFVAFFSTKTWLPDSFTQFKNKIGLVDGGGEFISTNTNVALSWPFKDCVLQGNMSKDESARNETFLNEVLAPDQVTKLLAPKALSNFRSYTEQGNNPANSDVEQLLKEGSMDGLYIKGNNLLALASLREKYRGKVKLIYIDPPYNTRGADDSFKYNDRFNHSTWLTFMKNRLELARDFLTEDGAIYVQLDYNEVHYCKVLMDEIFGRNNFQREIIWRIGWLSGYKTIEQNWIRNHDSILFYSKNDSQLDFIKQYIPYPEGYVRRDGKAPTGKGYAIEDTWNCYDIDSLSDFANDKLNSIALESFNSEKVGNFKGQKNEALIKRIIEAHTREGDLVLDFFGGSGTTASVAHKLRRKWIMVEQVENQIQIATERLQKTLQGDHKGISKQVGWSGGGNFLYAELAQEPESWIASIEEARSEKDLDQVWVNLSKSSFLTWAVSGSNMIESLDEFEDLTFDQKRELLFLCIDKNSLYVNYTEIDSADSISETDRALTKAFYEA